MLIAVFVHEGAHHLDGRSSSPRRKPRPASRSCSGGPAQVFALEVSDSIRVRYPRSLTQGSLMLAPPHLGSPRSGIRPRAAHWSWVPWSSPLPASTAIRVARSPSSLVIIFCLGPPAACLTGRRPCQRVCGQALWERKCVVTVLYGALDLTASQVSGKLGPMLQVPATAPSSRRFQKFAPMEGYAASESPLAMAYMSSA